MSFNFTRFNCASGFASKLLPADVAALAHLAANGFRNRRREEKITSLESHPSVPTTTPLHTETRVVRSEVPHFFSIYMSNLLTLLK